MACGIHSRFVEYGSKRLRISIYATVGDGVDSVASDSGAKHSAPGCAAKLAMNPRTL